MMHKLLIGVFVSVLLVSCNTVEAGERGRPCLEEGRCAHDYLICGPDEICIVCGQKADQPCCQGGTCESGFECSQDNTCSPCGAINEKCCEGASCEGYAYCGEDGVCHHCGVTGEICCPGSECYFGASCGSDGRCYDCGGPDEPCCEGNICLENALKPWQEYACSPDGICQECGGMDELCCAGQTCSEWYDCSPEGTCQSCGNLDGEPCPGSVCRDWFVAYAGECTIPFYVDHTTDASVCEKASKPSTYSGTGDSNWCYWYAAFFTHDLRLCERIGWDEMQAKCKDGKNPEDYWTLTY